LNSQGDYFAALKTVGFEAPSDAWQ
jgi:hypothetical protein